MAATVYPPGPRAGSLYGSGSETVDLSTTDKVWDANAVRSPVGVRVDAATTVKLTFIDGTVDTHVLSAGEFLPIPVVQVWKVGTAPLTGIHAIY